MINWKEEEPAKVKNWQWNISANNSKRMGFLQKEQKNYHQPFKVNDGKQIDAGNTINDQCKDLEARKRFFSISI